MKTSCTFTKQDVYEMVRFEEVLQFMKFSTHKLSKNYNELFNHHEILAYTYVEDEKGAISFCSSVARKHFWPAGTYRILNRSFKNPAHNKPFQRFNIEWNLMINDQIKWLNSNVSDFRHAIISRKLESVNTLKSLIDQTKNDGLKLYFLDAPVWICEDRKSSDCFQIVIAYSVDEQLYSKDFI